MDPPQDPRALLELDEFLRALAPRLLRNAHDAEDLAQDTWLAYFAHASPPPERVRDWVARVASNLAITSLRERQRHVLCESIDDFGPCDAGLASATERASLRHVIDQSVERLDEPYRSAIVQRFLEERNVAAIAHDSSVPAETVRTRLKRALALLRSSPTLSCVRR